MTPQNTQTVTSDDVWYVIEDQGALLLNLSIYNTLDGMTQKARRCQLAQHASEAQIAHDIDI